MPDDIPTLSRRLRSWGDAMVGKDRFIQSRRNGVRSDTAATVNGLKSDCANGVVYKARNRIVMQVDRTHDETIEITATLGTISPIELRLLLTMLAEAADKLEEKGL